MDLSDPFHWDDCLVSYDLPAEQYHKVEALSASGCKQILRSPAHFKVWRTQQKEPTPAMQFGTAAHTAILEPDKLDATVVKAPKFDRRTKDGKAAAEEFEKEHAGKIVLAVDTYENLLRLRDAVARHPGAQALLRGTKKEVSLFWTDLQYRVPCKARYDAMSGGIVDVKTTEDASLEAFGRTIASYLYHLQAAFYFSGSEHALSRTPDFFAFLACEKEPPFGIGCYVLEQAHLLAGARHCDEALSRYAQAIESQSWSCYPEIIQTAKLPSWAMRFDN